MDSRKFSGDVVRSDQKLVVIDRNICLCSRRRLLTYLFCGVSIPISTLLPRKSVAQNFCAYPFYDPFLCHEQTMQQQRMLEEFFALATLYAMMSNLSLDERTWPVRRPTQGRLRLKNDTSDWVEGNLLLAVTPRNSRIVEDEKVKRYELAPDAEKVIRFKKGPVAEEEGDKNLVAKTENSKVRVEFEAYDL